MSTGKQTKTTSSAGLAGLEVAESKISSVDGTRGVLEYRGFDISDLAAHSNFRKSPTCCGTAIFQTRVNFKR